MKEVNNKLKIIYRATDNFPFELSNGHKEAIEGLSEILNLIEEEIDL